MSDTISTTAQYELRLIQSKIERAVSLPTEANHYTCGPQFTQTWMSNPRRITGDLCDLLASIHGMIEFLLHPEEEAG